MSHTITKIPNSPHCLEYDSSSPPYNIDHMHICITRNEPLAPIGAMDKLHRYTCITCNEPSAHRSKPQEHRDKLDERECECTMCDHHVPCLMCNYLVRLAQAWLECSQSLNSVDDFTSLYASVCMPATQMQ